MLTTVDSPGPLLDPKRKDRIIAIINEEFISVFEEMVEVFGVNIEVKHGRDTVTEIIRDKNEGRKVYFYVDTFPLGSYQAASINPRSIFGFFPSESVHAQISFTPPGFAQFKQNGIEIPSPESPNNNFLGCIFSNNIFVYPYILTSDAWEKSDRVKVLSAICYWSLPVAVNKSFPNSGENSTIYSLNALRPAYRSKCLPENTTEKFTEKFEIFLKNLNSGIVESLNTDINKAREVIKKHSGEYFSDLSLVSVHQRLIVAMKEELLARDLEQEFEVISAMESVETVRVRGSRYLVIKTSPIFQVPYVNHEDKTASRFDIGEFTIQIDTFSMPLTRTAIRIFQNGYLGTHQHNHISGSDQDICFGIKSDIGLNGPIDNLLSNFTIVPLVNLILTFLKKEASTPILRNANHLSTPEPKRYEYHNLEEREEEKRAFVKLVSEAMIGSSTKNLKQVVDSTHKRLHDCHIALLKEKKLLRGCEALLESLNIFFGDSQNIAEKTLSLLKEQSIFGVSLSSEELIIYFYCPRITTAGSTSLFHDYILKIVADSLPILLVSSPTKLFRSILLVSPYDTWDQEDEAMLSNLQSGQILEVLESVQTKIINNTFDPEVKVSRSKKEKE